MNQVDIYIGNNRLDLFDDEEITINLSVQNYQDLDKIFTDYTQSFTIPATPANNEILAHYYRTDVNGSVIAERFSEENGSNVMSLMGDDPSLVQDVRTTNTFDGRLRPTARIEINSIHFRDGVIQIEDVLMRGTEPYAYTLTFYGYLVNLTDLFGEDYLYDLDLSAYDHTYDGATILQGFNSDALFSGDIFYPLMSPVRNWVYNVSNSSDPRHEDDIQFVTGHSGHHHGINYNELKPAVRVTKILDAIQGKYGITFSGSFLSDTTFQKLYIWAHRFEGYLYDNASVIDWQLINMNRNTGSGSQFNLTTDTWTVASTSEYQLRIQVLNSSANYELGLFRNGVEIGIAREDANAGTNTTFFDGYILNAGDEIQLKIRPQVPVNMTYQVTDYTAYTASDGIPITQQFEVDQSISASYAFELAMSPLMPEIKVADFLGGIVKMHNLVIIPTSTSDFTFYTLDEWYENGSDLDLQAFINIDEIGIKRPDLFRRISFSYQPTEQILGYEYEKNNTIGFGDLRSDFQFDGDEFNVELPFECPLFGLLEDIDGGGNTNILVYLSQTREPDTQYENRFQKYLGSPILIYGDFSLDINSNPIAFVDETNTQTQVNEVWYANTSSTSLGTGLANALTWGADIDPYYLTPVGKSLYQYYWSTYIQDLYSKNKRVFEVDAILPLGKILNLDLNNLVIWNNQKFKINNANLNLATGRVKLELLNEV